MESLNTNCKHEHSVSIVNISSILGNNSYVTINLRNILNGKIEIGVWKTIGYKNIYIECSNLYSMAEVLKIGSMWRVKTLWVIPRWFFNNVSRLTVLIFFCAVIDLMACKDLDRWRETFSTTLHRNISLWLVWVLSMSCSSRMFCVLEAHPSFLDLNINVCRWFPTRRVWRYQKGNQNP